MRSERLVPRSLVESAIDGDTVDWDAEAGLGAGDRDQIDNLRFVAELAARYRDDDPGPPAGAVARASVVPFPLASADQARTTPATWGHFELLELVGSGSFGDVYRARDTKLDREVAIKLLRPEAARNRSIRTRVLDEGRALARVDHPNVVSVFSVEEHDGRIGLCMEFVRGRTLEDLLEEQGTMSVAEATHVGREICRALSAVHAEGLLHRDVKTRNVMRADGGRIVLMDFGAGTLGDLQASARITGTPMYLAPEVLNGERPSAQSDVYSLAVMLYRLVTRQYPVEASSLAELRDRHRNQEWTDVARGLAQFPDSFARPVRRALSYNPADRPRYAESFLAALERAEARRPWWPAAVVVAAALAVGGVWALQTSRPADPAFAPGAEPRVAVLALRNLTDVPGWRVAILEEDLRSALARVPGLALIGRGSVDRVHAGFGSDPEAFDRELGAPWVLEGAVRHDPSLDSGDMRVTIRLLHAGVQRWEGSFTSPGRGVPVVPTDIVALITTAVGLNLSPSRSEASHSGNPDARQLYGEARRLLRAARLPEVSQARVLLEQALGLDPGYALAHAALAQTLLDLEVLGAVSTADAYTGALASAGRALALDQSLADSHLTLADVKLNFEWDWDAAAGAFARAIEINPNHVQARINYSKYLAALGRFDEAIGQAQAARSLDVLSDATGNLGLMLYYARQYDDAIRVYGERVADAPELPQVQFTAGRILAGAGRFDEAVAHLERSIQLSGGVDPGSYRVAEMARTLAQAGRRDEALNWQARLAPVSAATSPTMLAYHAYVQAALGDRDRAFALLDEAVTRQALVLLWAAVDPRLDPLRGDERFTRLLARLGLPR